MTVSVFGQRLKFMRIARGYRQSDIAKVLNVQRATISSYELGKAVPPHDKMKAIADYLHTTPAYLNGETDDPNDNTPVKIITDNPPVDLANKLKILIKEIQEPLNRVTVNRADASDTTVKTALKMLNCTLDVVRGLEQNGESPDKE